MGNFPKNFFLFLGLILSCQGGINPNETDFQNLVSDLILKEAKGVEYNIIVVDPILSYSNVGIDLQRIIEGDLKNHNFDVKQMDLKGDYSNLPQMCLADPSGRRPGIRHFLLFAKIEGNGKKRLLIWRFTCGPLCGGGKNIEISWKVSHWESKELIEVVY